MATAAAASFACQFCNAKLTVAGAGLDYDRPGTSTVFGDVSRIEESFIVLEDKKQGGAGGPGGKGLDESFVMLGTASLLRPPPGGAGQSGRGGGRDHQDGTPAAFGLDAKLQALSQLFQMASSRTPVDHPLCLDCAAQLKDEMEAQVQEMEREIAAYSSAITKLEQQRQKHLPLAPEAFQREMDGLLEEEAEERQRADALEAELAEAHAELRALQATAADIDALEERYWHDHNDYQLQLRQHGEERDALLSRIDRASQRLQLLRNTNVYNDAFKIWHDGPFGTISGFRLGRTPEVPVEWDEINAAWGQAVLLLHTMAQHCQLHFNTARLLPMGSHPRVSTSSGTYDLFGPVNKLWSSGYDRAMVCFLGCLKEFGEYAQACDKARVEASGRSTHATHTAPALSSSSAAFTADMGAAGSPASAASSSKIFGFPFPIDGDKVNNITIKLTLNKDAKWTKALKFMLADLKVALQWMVKHDMQGEVKVLHSLGPEGPAGATGPAPLAAPPMR